jgi:4'-phosphopantetheinyl transferase
LNPPAETIQWPSCADVPQLAGGEIHVWATTLALSPEQLQKNLPTLSVEELARAKRFKFDVHRNRFIAGRGALRAILGKTLGASPATLRFEYQTNGKPELAGEFASAGIHFNVTHTEDLALVAVTRVGRIGVDVEGVRAIKNADELVARFFSPRENETFQKVPEEEKPAAFFNLWTRKEALLKATGEGITRSLSLVEVSFLPGEPARLLAVSGDSEKAAEWSLRELTPATGFTGAIAIKRKTSNIEHRTPNFEGQNVGATPSTHSGEAEINVQCWKWG